ncbi:acyl-CoA Delta-9 desaturase-like [Centruroides vittatus]|uniref:acyl-CoA Delta-9 desaturase-like n=1 Tax=Centruroides vittatus TaxID=120091 RepID=UPI00350F2C1B
MENVSPSITSASIQTPATMLDPEKEKKREIVWRNVILFLLLHLSALYGIYLIFTSAMWQTTLFAYLLYAMSAMGVTAGAHRLWSHRAYKAKWPLRLVLAIWETIAFQNDIYEWVRDHRVHHKFSETDADPHNAKRGFFFSHIGWLLVRKHPDVIEKGKTIDLNDIWADPIVRFQRRHYTRLVVMLCFVIPTLLPVWCWGETYWNSYFVATLLRYCVSLNATWLVNSAAHMWGNRPYDKSINPRQNRIVTLWALGEGFHNYHHTFPWDYSASELGSKINFTTVFIDCMKWLGLAYDLRTVSPDIIKQRRLRTGDGSE